MNKRFTTRSRSFAGFVATLVNPDTLELRVIHRGGWEYDTGSIRYYTRVRHSYTATAVLADLCREIDEWEGNWKIRTISTPQSILSDITGRQDGHCGARPTTPESVVLSQIDRIDLWEGRHANQEKAKERRDRRQPA